MWGGGAREGGRHLLPLWPAGSPLDMLLRASSFVPGFPKVRRGVGADGVHPPVVARGPGALGWRGPAAPGSGWSVPSRIHRRQHMRSSRRLSRDTQLLYPGVSTPDRVLRLCGRWLWLASAGVLRTRSPVHGSSPVYRSFVAGRAPHECSAAPQTGQVRCCWRRCSRLHVCACVCRVLWYTCRKHACVVRACRHEGAGRVDVAAAGVAAGIIMRVP